MTAYIYTLSDPRDGRVRYVGKTTNPTKRLAYHIYNFPGTNPRKENWIKSLREHSMNPVMSAIEECEGLSWKDREIYWIAYYRDKYDDLTNIMDGGDCPLDSVSFRNQRISKFAKKLKLQTYVCYICKGITVSKNCICRHCLQIISHDRKDEWANLFTRQYPYEGRYKEIPFSLLNKKDYEKLMNITE